jgi:hypothetical protein
MGRRKTKEEFYKKVKKGREKLRKETKEKKNARKKIGKKLKEEKE